MTAPRATALDSMFRARSVAVIGASARRGSSGWHALDELVSGGFDGEVYPVNPNYEELSGLTCYPSIDDTPPVDLALVLVPNRVLEDQVKALADAGVGSAVIFASGHDDRGEPTLLEPLTRIANDAGITICGANCMGFVDVERRLRALAYPEEELEPGGITWLAQSGSAFTALLHNDRGLRFNLAVSSGQELTTTVADYMLHALARGSTKVIALFIESVRDPASFRNAVAVAEERDVPVVALKVGTQAMARRLVTAHSGALAGEEGAYEALFDAHGVMRVKTMNEMADVLELMSSGRRAGPGGLATIHDSGGERAHLIDVAAEVGVRFADISAATRAALTESLEPGLPAVNPLDAWGTGNDSDRIFGECMTALLADEDTAGLAMVADLKKDDPDASYAPLVKRIALATDKPFAVISNLSSAIDAPTAAEVRAAGVAVLEDTATGLAAFRHLFEYRDHRALPELQPPPPPGPEVTKRWRARLAEPGPQSTPQTFELLEDFGIPTIATRRVHSVAQALRAALQLGYPVALKSDKQGLAHKTEAGGVKLGLTSARAVADAYRDLCRRLGPDVVVQAMAPPGVEMGLGIVNDSQFGPVLVVSAGGTLIEVLHDRATALHPIDEPRARRLIDRLKVRPLLDGARGSAPFDTDALVDAVLKLSALATELGNDLGALDINPLVVTHDGCVAVDALVEPGQDASTPATRTLRL
ncbi:MAG: acetate--CoA ligase family protein [Actinobacteria bacterium]|nr:acetate--CoA ligase family protein [Actinomycetota bacterium]